MEQVSLLNLASQRLALAKRNLFRGLGRELRTFLQANQVPQSAGDQRLRCSDHLWVVPGAMPGSAGGQWRCAPVLVVMDAVTVRGGTTAGQSSTPAARCASKSVPMWRPSESGAWPQNFH